MIVKTKTKIALARMAYRVLMVCGIARQQVVTRGGIRWNLDLCEGIDFAIYMLGAFEGPTRDALRRLVRPGYTVLDIGANIGAHTLPLASAVGDSGRVYAFEPTDFAYEKLRSNLSLNPHLERRVTVEQAMLVSDPSRNRREIHSSWPLEKFNDQHPKHLGRRKLASASVIRLDDYMEQRRIAKVDLIKIDVDGWEHPVLAGGEILLRRFHPVIVMELSPYVHTEEGNSFDELVQLLKRLDYSFAELESGKPLPTDVHKLRKMIPDGASVNAIAV